MTLTTFKSHPVHASARQLAELIARPELAEQGVSDDERASYARDKIAGIVRALEILLKQTPPAVVVMPALDQINSNLQSPISEVSQFLGNKNVGHLANAASYLDANVVSQFWGFAARPSDKGAAEYVRKTVEVATESIRNLVTQRDALLSDLEALRKKVQESETRLAEAIEASSRERSEAAAAVANLDLQFSERERERATKFDESLSAIRKDASVAQGQIAQEAKVALSDTVRIRDDAARILGVVGEIGTTSNFRAIAESESRQANAWRWITVGLFAVGIGLAVATFVRFYFSAVTADTAVAIGVRLLYAIAVTAPAWYTARESARHRTNADKAKQTELELAALGPFIELMDKSKKDEIKEKLTEKYFGRSVEAHEVRTPLNTRQLRAFVIEIIKAVKPA